MRVWKRARERRIWTGGGWPCALSPALHCAALRRAARRTAEQAATQRRPNSLYLSPPLRNLTLAQFNLTRLTLARRPEKEGRRGDDGRRTPLSRTTFAAAAASRRNQRRPIVARAPRTTRAASGAELDIWVRLARKCRLCVFAFCQLARDKQTAPRVNCRAPSFCFSFSFHLPISFARSRRIVKFCARLFAHSNRLRPAGRANERAGEEATRAGAVVELGRLSAGRALVAWLKMVAPRH